MRPPEEPGRVSGLAPGPGVRILDEAMANEPILLRFGGTFDAAEGWRLHDTLSKIEPGSQVTLDFRQVHDFHDFAIALLAQDICSREGHIAALGLCQHQLRMLRYFGVDIEGLDGHPADAEAHAAEPRL